MVQDVGDLEGAGGAGIRVCEMLYLVGLKKEVRSRK